MYFRFAGFRTSIDLSVEFLKNYYVEIDENCSVAGSEFEGNEDQV